MFGGVASRRHNNCRVTRSPIQHIKFKDNHPKTRMLVSEIIVKNEKHFLRNLEPEMITFAFPCQSKMIPL